MILAAGHALVSASAHKVNDDDDLTSTVIALQIGSIGQKRCAEEPPSADHGRAHVGDS
jgi:hypothetical protein